MSLADLQKLLGEALPETKPTVVDPVWTARANDALSGSARMSPVDQLEVYREQFWIRHVHCLAEDFPAVHALVGEEEFAELVRGYLAQHPPTDFMLRNLGARFAEFLASRDALLADLARVEWAFIDVFDAADAAPLDMASIATMTEDAWTNARILFQPFVVVLRLSSPAHTTRDAFRKNEKVARAEPAPTTYVVYRRELLLYGEVVDDLGGALLERLARGETLGHASEAVANESGRAAEVEASIAAWFTRWAGLGWIARVES